MRGSSAITDRLRAGQLLRTARADEVPDGLAVALSGAAT
jgi:hypothetical protein